MKLGALSREELRSRLADNTLVLRTGPFATRIHSPMPQIADGLLRLYADFPLGDGEFCDFHVRVEQIMQGLGMAREMADLAVVRQKSVTRLIAHDTVNRCMRRGGIELHRRCRRNDKLQAIGIEFPV